MGVIFCKFWNLETLPLKLYYLFNQYKVMIIAMHFNKFKTNLILAVSERTGREDLRQTYFIKNETAKQL